MELKRWVTADVYPRNDDEFTEQRGFWGVPLGLYRHRMSIDVDVQSHFAVKQGAGQSSDYAPMSWQMP